MEVTDRTLEKGEDAVIYNGVLPFLQSMLFLTYSKNNNLTLRY